MFDRLVGNQRAKDTLRRMLAGRRVPGALLFAGEDAIGKKLFALELAKARNCLAPSGVEACDKCSSCVRITHFADAPADKNDDAKHIIWSEHRDVGLVRAEKNIIKVDQARELERETNFRPHEGRARIFIIEEADKLNPQASNALLKTLEEVAPTSHLILLSARPANLLTTIRSRCQTIRFAPLTAAEIENYLVCHKRRAGEEARLAANVSRGRLGLALSLNLDAYREGREAMLSVLDALTAVEADRARLLRAAEDLSDAKRKDEFEPRLDVLETLIRDAWLLSLDPTTKIVNEDIRDRLARLGAKLKSRHAADWMARIQELRGQLVVNINRRVATDALLLSMANAAAK
ncbi:MAG TPA: DNA polymerase III subunit delta' [Pyrinomonadaceae bacterium]|jgi:DNA polymerase-3 subunit delta'|nr:DNA polymerase III subunit delta' [Pyrinomonadaceae bacterium]